MRRVTLRETVFADIPVFFEQQTDPIAREVAAYPLKAWERFESGWRRSIEEEVHILRTIDVEGVVAGHLVAWQENGDAFFGYWLDRALWGQRIMTAAIAEFLPLIPSRPLFATVAVHNDASAALLIRAGFIEVERRIADDGVLEILFRLD